MTTLSIVIPVFNKFSLTERCLSSILKNSNSEHQITLIDNASTDETAARLPELRDLFISQGWMFEIVTNPANVGFGRAMNQGARLSTGENLALINNDTYLLPNWDKNLSQILQNNPQLDLIFPYIDETYPFNESRILADGAKFERRNKMRQRSHAFSGVLMFFRKSAFDKLQGFDERFFVTYEDTDLRVRMMENNMKFAMVGGCFIWHQAMSTRSDKTLLPSGYELEGKKLFFDKWGFHFSDREKTSAARWQRRLTRWRNYWGIL